MGVGNCGTRKLREQYDATSRRYCCLGGLLLRFYLSCLHCPPRIHIPLALLHVPFANLSAGRFNHFFPSSPLATPFKNPIKNSRASTGVPAVLLFLLPPSSPLPTFPSPPALLTEAKLPNRLSLPPANPIPGAFAFTGVPSVNGEIGVPGLCIGGVCVLRCAEACEADDEGRVKMSRSRFCWPC